MQHDAARTGKWGRKKHTRFHSTRALHSTLASKLSPQRRGCISLSLSLSPRRAPFSVWNRGAVEAECRTRTRIHRPPISKRSATLRPGMPFPFGNPLEPVAHSRPRAPIHAIGPPLTGGDWSILARGRVPTEGSSSTLLCTIERMGRGGCVDGYCEVWLEFYRAPISSVLGFDAEFNILFVF